jgi:glutamate-1-semialdehyde aminotransferase
MPDQAAMMPRLAPSHDGASTARAAPDPQHGPVAPPSADGAGRLVPQRLDLAAGDGPFAVSRAVGATVFDAAGTPYLDLCMGHGALLLGHGAAAVKDAVRRQLDDGWLYGFAHAGAARLAELIAAAGPANERVALCTSESDATLVALRAARATTGRDGVVLFAGSHHGLHDAALVTALPMQAPSANDAVVQRKVHIGAGVPVTVDATVDILPYGGEQVFDWIRRRRDRLAAVMVEGVPSGRPTLTHGPWLRTLQSVCRDSGVVMILDETLSGFRLGFGGAQEAFGLHPDLVTYGHALGGGLPLGAVAGRASVMSAFDGPEPHARIFAGDTHAGNPLSVAAATAVLEVLSASREFVYPQLAAAAAALTGAFTTAAAAHGLAAGAEAAGSLFRLHFGPPADAKTQALERAFYAALFERKVIVHAAKRCFLSTAHTVADIAALATAFSDSLAAAVTASG